MRRAFVSVFLLLAVLAAPARAWPPTFGAEFTFTNDDLISRQSEGFGIRSPTLRTQTPANLEARDKMRAAVALKCEETKECTIDGNTVKYTDGWWFKISTDPAVIEIQTKPQTLGELKKNRDRIQSAIFDSAES